MFILPFCIWLWHRGENSSWQTPFKVHEVAQSVWQLQVFCTCSVGWWEQGLPFPGQGGI